jgi:hypothetical protein
MAAGRLQRSGESQPGTAHPERVTQGDRAAVGVDVLGVLAQAEAAQHGNDCAAKASFELDVDGVQPDPQTLQELARGRNRAHDGGSTLPRPCRELERRGYRAPIPNELRPRVILGGHQDQG